MARNINALNSIRASGDTLPPDLARYIETMPPTVRDKLAQWGILSGSRVAASQPLAEHLADWKTALPAKGNTDRHSVITLTMDCHTHLYAGNLSAALDVLPDLSAPVRQTVVATGTDDAMLSNCGSLPNRLSPSLSLDGPVSKSLVESGGVNAANVLNAGTGLNHAEVPEKPRVLTAREASDTLVASTRRSAGAAERAGLENRCTPQATADANATYENAPKKVSPPVSPRAQNRPLATSATTTKQLPNSIGRGGGEAAPIDPDLAAVVAAWPTLPADVRRTIVQVVKLTTKMR